MKIRGLLFAKWKLNGKKSRELISNASQFWYDLFSLAFVNSNTSLMLDDYV